MSRLWDFEERHLRCDRSGRKRLGIVSRSPAAIAAGVENPEKGCGMMPFPVIGTFPCKSLSDADGSGDVADAADAMDDFLEVGAVSHLQQEVQGGV